MGFRVLLFSVNQYAFPYAVFPLGLASVETALRRAGHETQLVDWSVRREPVGPLVAAFRPDLVGISLRNIDDALIQRRETFFGELEGLCTALRRCGRAPIVLGGSGFSIFPEVLLERTGADYGIRGEGEAPLLALVAALGQGGDVESVPGLVYRRGDAVVVNPPTVSATAEWLTPDRDPELARHYLERSSMLNVQTQRGCALRCCYCTYPLLEGRRARRRPPESVADEFAAIERAGGRYVFLVDSVFNSSAEHVAGICEALVRRGVRVQWCCFLRPQGLTRELMRLMVRAGLRHIEFGSDSFCDAVLAAYGKQLTFDDVRVSSELAAAEHVDYAHFLICGGPGETLETLETSIANSRRLPNATLMARVGMRVYPGTPLHARVCQEQGAGAPADLLLPYYYLSPAVTEAAVFERLRAASRTLPNWIFDDPPPAYTRMAERLRARGVVGPLWAYFAMMQRLGGAFSGESATGETSGGEVPVPGGGGSRADAARASAG